MPELPEVETILRQLRPRLLGKSLVSVIREDPLVAQASLLRAKGKVRGVERRGKHIVVSLEGKSAIIFHLAMTGHFTFDPGAQKYRCAQLLFAEGFSLNFHSIRRFSRARWVSDAERTLAGLGKDPLHLSAGEFISLLQGYPQGNLKNKLMDQKMLAGIGNIYAQEALYHAGIAPQHRIQEISAPQLRKLHHHLQRVLQLAIARKGTTVSNYSHLEGRGDFQNFLTVYQKETCPQKHSLERIVIGGRGTWWCKRCQR